MILLIKTKSVIVSIAIVKLSHAHSWWLLRVSCQISNSTILSPKHRQWLSCNLSAVIQHTFSTHCIVLFSSSYFFTPAVNHNCQQLHSHWDRIFISGVYNTLYFCMKINMYCLKESLIYRVYTCHTNKYIWYIFVQQQFYFNNLLAQRETLKNSSLSRILCDNTDMRAIQRNSMLLQSAR